MTPVALTIAGSDPSGGAGLQADLKTFHQHGVYGECVVTLLTVQNTQGVQAVHTLDPGFVRRQIDAVIGDIPPAAAKTGALGDAALIDAVAGGARTFSFPLVVDPVMRSKHGAPLIDQAACSILRDRLVPLAYLVSPNMHEAATLAGFEVESEDQMAAAAKAIADLGPRYVLVKGGALPGEAVDLLWDGQSMQRFTSPRLNATNTHGTGCVLSAAITAWLAKGTPLAAAVSRAKAFLTEALKSAPGLGNGIGPVNLHANPEGD